MTYRFSGSQADAQHSQFHGVNFHHGGPMRCALLILLGLVIGAAELTQEQQDAWAKAVAESEAIAARNKPPKEPEKAPETKPQDAAQRPAVNYDELAKQMEDEKQAAIKEKEENRKRERDQKNKEELKKGQDEMALIESRSWSVPTGSKAKSIPQWCRGVWEIDRVSRILLGENTVRIYDEGSISKQNFEGPMTPLDIKSGGDWCCIKLPLQSNGPVIIAVKQFGSLIKLGYVYRSVDGKRDLVYGWSEIKKLH